MAGVSGLYPHSSNSKRIESISPMAVPSLSRNYPGSTLAKPSTLKALPHAETPASENGKEVSKIQICHFARRDPFNAGWCEPVIGKAATAVAALCSGDQALGASRKESAQPCVALRRQKKEAALVELPQLIMFDKQFPRAEIFPYAKELIKYTHEKVIFGCRSIIG